MKLLATILLPLLGCTAWAGDTITPALLEQPPMHAYDFVWGDSFAKLPHDPRITIDTQGGGLGLVYFGEAPTDMELQTIDPAFLSTLQTGQFAIEGTISYYKLLPGSFLEMWCYFAPEKPGDPDIVYMTLTLSQNDPLSKVAGWESDTHFQLPFDLKGAKTPLKKVVLKVHFSGGYDTHVVLNNVKMIEYPRNTFPATVASVRTLKPGFSSAPERISTGPQSNVIADLPIDDYKASDEDQKLMLEQAPTDYHKSVPKTEFGISYPKESDGTSGLQITQLGQDKGPCILALLAVPQKLVDQIAGNSYGITGEVSYSDVKNGALCMASCYSPTGLSAPKDLWFQDADGSQFGGQSDRMGHIGGTREWGPFYLGFTRGNSYLAHYALKRLVFNVVLQGPGPSTIRLRHLKLVQYPNANPVTPSGPNPPTIASAPPQPPIALPAAPTPGLDGRSFLFGALSVMAVIGAFLAVRVINSRFARRRHEREMRRIASLDT